MGHEDTDSTVLRLCRRRRRRRRRSVSCRRVTLVAVECPSSRPVFVRSLLYLTVAMFWLLPSPASASLSPRTLSADDSSHQDRLSPPPPSPHHHQQQQQEQQQLPKEHHVLPEHLRSLTNYEIIIPKRVDAHGQPFPKHRHYLRRKRSLGFSAADEDDGNRVVNESAEMLYTFSAFGRDIDLRLVSDRDFAVGGLRVQHMTDNETWLGSDLSESSQHCFYSGFVDQDPGSSAVLSTCENLLGVVHSFNERFFIEPIRKDSDRSRSDSEDSGIPHVIYRYMDDSGTAEKKHQCQTKIAEKTESADIFQESAAVEDRGSETENRSRSDGRRLLSRTKRSMSVQRFVEVMVVADAEMKRFHGDDLEHYLLTLMAIVASIYRDQSIGNAINIYVVKIVVLESKEANVNITNNAAATLRDFCRWQKEANVADDDDPLHHDTAVLITKQDICRSNQKCDTLGLAELGTMCDGHRSCSIVKDNGLSAAFTIAHELGHVFSLRHDDECSQFRNQTHLYHIMAPTLDHNTRYWSWSECSRNKITEFVDAGNAECLNDKPTDSKPFPVLNHEFDETVIMPGSTYTVDQQCAHIYEPNSVRCPYLPVCTRLWCTIPGSERSGCSTRHMPWADGTPCSNPGANESMWCFRGHCVPVETRASVDGQWGAWAPYGPCTRTCGGGIRSAKRLCNNPSPMNGGRFCTGRRVKFRSCNHLSCPVGSMDFREQQCRSFNGQHFNINGLSPNVQWVAKYFGKESKDRCKLFCRDISSAAYYQLADRVIDGTKCGLDTTDVCVMGHCRQAGCDNRLGSSTDQDDCGICGGNNSTCERVREKFSDNVVLEYGYNRVTRIPRGSTKVDIQQVNQFNTHEDDTYLVLKNGSGDYVLNGNFILSAYPKTVHLESISLEYTGSRHIVERISGPGPLPDDIEVYVLMVGEMLHRPQIAWEYNVKIDPSRLGKMFTWNKTVTKWSDCSHPCQGKKRRMAVCVHSSTGSIVPDQNCLALKRPSDSERLCNTKCHFRWRTVQGNKCLAKCNEEGFGEIRCQKVTNDSNGAGQNSSFYVDEKFCRDISNDSALVRCVGACTSVRWVYTSWSQCSHACGGGLQWRTALCQSDQGVILSNDSCPMEHKVIKQSCNTDGCPRWSTGNWTHCSVSCGSGWKSRHVSCTQDDRTVTKTRCKTNEPDNRDKCDAGPCPKWHVEKIGPCSVTCGKGFQTMTIICHSHQGAQISDRACDAGARPRSDVPCMTNCSATIRTSSLANVEHEVPQKSAPAPTPAPAPVKIWRTGSWTECSASCGSGFRQRYVSCRDLNGNINADSLCENFMKPADVERCNVQSCSVWRTGDWTHCSATCGKGVETRFVACVTLEELEEQLLNPNPSQCDVLVKPPTERLCNRVNCLPDKQLDILTISSNSVVGTAVWRAGPWGPCSSTCDQGRQRRRVVCQDERGESSNCDPGTQPEDERSCSTSPCPNWNYGQWGQCDVTCGGGFQQRMVHCQLPDGQILPDASCPLESVPHRRQSCAAISCPGTGQRVRWQKGRWSSCSVTCGKGQRRRPIVCVDGSGKRISDHLCKTHRPKGTTWCRRPRCPLWSTSAWSECSATCDASVKRRTVLCTYQNSTVERSRCGHLTEPDATEPCLVRKCEPFYWAAGNWSECSQPCSFGIQTRNISCVEMATGKEVHHSYCPETGKPSTQMDCSVVPCSTIWITTDWTRCSASCGKGLQRRAVSCRAMAREGWLLPAHVDLQSCNQTERPISEQICSYGDCTSLYHWETTSWSQCSETCGFGRAYRDSYCFDSNGTKHQDENCDASLQPPLTRPCYMGPCYSSSCSEVKQRTALVADGEFNLLLNGKLTQIYCGDMARSHPKEYITLLTDENENYSEIFDKRLTKPNKCPSNITDLEKCSKCYRSNFHSAGHTKFSKVRLNVTSLLVIGNDFTFSSSQGKRKIPFATGGDCYSRTGNCPQGKFQVDLMGTRFRVASDVEWQSIGSKTVSQIHISTDRQIVKGRCGGHCGRCSPRNGLKLELIP